MLTGHLLLLGALMPMSSMVPIPLKDLRSSEVTASVAVNYLRASPAI